MALDSLVMFVEAFLQLHQDLHAFLVGKLKEEVAEILQVIIHSNVVTFQPFNY